MTEPKTWHLWGHDWTPCQDGWQMEPRSEPRVRLQNSREPRVKLQNSRGSWFAWLQGDVSRACEGRTTEEALTKLLGSPQQALGVWFYPQVPHFGLTSYRPDIPGPLVLFSFSPSSGWMGIDPPYQDTLEGVVREWLDDPIVLRHLTTALARRLEGRPIHLQGLHWLQRRQARQHFTF